MALLARLKERLLGDERASLALDTVGDLYDSADDPEAFHAALADGDLERAADHSSFTVDELREKIDVLRLSGEGLAADYPDAATTDKDEFVRS